MDLTEYKKNDKKVLKGIAKKEKSQNMPTGRPPKNPEEKMSEKITVNFTPTEKQKLLDLSAERYNVPLTTLIRNLLQEKEFI